MFSFFQTKKWKKRGVDREDRMPPGKNMDDLWTIFRSGMWRLWYKLSSEGKTRFYNEFLPLLHHTKHDVMGSRDDDSYYLVYLGSKPSARGKGYARKLIEHMTARVCAIFPHFLINVNGN
jgi:ribosomal protein S18 acetylase RimI-like enzyme